MSNAWFYYFLPLAIGAAFIGVSCFFIFHLRHAIRDGRTGRGRKLASLIFILIGVLVPLFVGLILSLAIVLFSPTPWQRSRLFNHVFRTPPNDIERFVILAPRAYQFHPLNTSRVVIDDPVSIDKIATILRHSKEISPNHPETAWTARMQIVTHTGTFDFEVDGAVPGDPNGTLIAPHLTGSASHWNLGDWRADGLDELLKNAVDAARKKRG